MNAIFWNSGYCETSEVYRLYISYKIALKKRDKHVIFSNRSIFCFGHTRLFRVYVNKIENSITFEIKAFYYQVIILMLLGSTDIKTIKDENAENVSYLEINVVVLVHCHIANNNYQYDS